MKWKLFSLSVLLCAFFCCSVFASASENPDRMRMKEVFEERIRGMEGFGKLPIIDVEFHWGQKTELKALTEKMDQNKIALTWLGPNENMGDEYSLMANQQYPSYFVPTTIHGDGPLWHGKKMELLDKLEKDVQTGQYFAMGEFEARHYPSDTNNRNVYLPLTSESFHRIFKLSQDYGIPFMIHHEAENTLLAEMETMLQQYPNARVIWNHVGRNRNYIGWSRWMGTRTVREFLEKYPNLNFDLVQSPPESAPMGYRQDILYDIKGGVVSLNPEWRKLFIDFPDRFVLGSDVNGGRWGEYETVFDRFRQFVLNVLPREVAEKIAYKNAWRLMTGDEWRTQAP